jgi:hypothetical protein
MEQAVKEDGGVVPESDNVREEIAAECIDGYTAACVLWS